MHIKHGPYTIAFLPLSGILAVYGAGLDESWPCTFGDLVNIIARVQDMVKHREQKLSNGDMLDEECIRVRDHIMDTSLDRIPAIKYAKAELGILGLREAKNWVESFHKRTKPFRGQITNWYINSYNCITGTLNESPIFTSPIHIINTFDGYSVVETQNSHYVLVGKEST